jgi:hypothetical protein
MDDEHILALVEAVHWTHFDAIHDFTANAAVVDDVGQLSVLSADRSGEPSNLMTSRRCSGRDVRFIARPPPRSVRAAFPHTAPTSGM